MKALRKVWERGKRGYALLQRHRYTTIAGTLVFFLILSLVPFVFWLTLLFGSRAFDALTMAGIGLFGWAEDLLLFLKENAAEGVTGASALFLITTLWSSSGFFYHLRRSGEIIYEYTRVKHGWKVRLSALLYTFGLLFFFAAAGGALFVAGVYSKLLPAWVSYPAWYLLALLLGFFAAWILNSYVCPYRCRPSDTAAGSFFTACAWLLASCAFAVYLKFGNAAQLYGALTLVVVFLLWLYWLMIVFVAGVIFNRRQLARAVLGHKKL